MTSDDARWLVSAVVLAMAGSLVFLSACSEDQDEPTGPASQSPSFSHTDDSGTKFYDTDAIPGNIKGDGDKICQELQTRDENEFGVKDDETWEGIKVDPPAEGTYEGFKITLSSDDQATHLDWEDVGANMMRAVLIKSGDSNLAYYYNRNDLIPPVFENDQGLHGEQEHKAISYFTLCHIDDPTATKSGVKFEDLDVDGVKDNDEPGLNGWEIRIYKDVGSTSGELDSGDSFVRSQTTETVDGQDGVYSFEVLPGDYIVCEVTQAGWMQSDPDNTICSSGSEEADGGYAVSLDPGQVDDGNHFGNAPTSIEVTVVDKNTDPVQGHRVIGVNSETGPYRDSEDPKSLIAEETESDGVAVLGNLNPGDSYCVRAVPVTVTSDRLIPPLQATEAPEVSTNRGTALSKKGDSGVTSVPVNVSHYKDACIKNPPLQPGDKVTLKLQVPADSVTGSFDIPGDIEEGQASAWYVAPKSAFDDVTVPWLDDLPDPAVPGAVPALLMTAGPDDGNGFNIKTDGPGTVESDKVKSSTGGFLTASFSTDGSETDKSVAMEPLYCKTSTLFEPRDDGGELELIGDPEPVKYGFLASKALEPLDSNEDTEDVEPAFGISYRQTAGEAKLKFRAKVDGNTQRLVADYVCDSDGCRITRERGKLTKAQGFELTLTSFQSDSEFGISWFLTGLPEGTDAGLWKITSSDDAMPNAARADTDDGLERQSLPSSCDNDQPTHQIGFD